MYKIYEVTWDDNGLAIVQADNPTSARRVVMRYLARVHYPEPDEMEVRVATISPNETKIIHIQGHIYMDGAD